MSDFLSRTEAAEYVKGRGLSCSKATLDKMVTVGGGPKYRIFGTRAVYTREDLDAWIESRLTAPRCSTSNAVAV